jgi:hypothetical protein
MDIERRLSIVLHEVADMAPPAYLVERTLDRLPPRQRASWFSPFLGAPAIAAAIAAIVIVALAVALIWRPGPFPPADDATPSPAPTPLVEPSPSPAAEMTPPACPAAQIEGTLVEGAPGELLLMEGSSLVPISWEPAYFTIVEDQRGRPAVQHDSGVMAFVDDLVLIGGGERDGGWYACGGLEVLRSPTPGPTPAVDVDDTAAWRALARLDPLIATGGIRQIRRLEWVGDALHLEVEVLDPAAGLGDAVEIGRTALRRAGFSGSATASEAGPTFVTLEIVDVRSVLARAAEPQCGSWWQMQIRALGDGAELRDEPLWAAAEVIRGRLTGLLQAFEGEHEVVLRADGRAVVLELREPPPDAIREGLLLPLPSELMAVPAGTGVGPGSGTQGLEPLLGGADIESARPALDMSGRPALEFTLQPSAADAFDAHAAAHLGDQVALVIEGVIFAAPTLNSRSFGGEVQVVGLGDLGIGVLLMAADRLSIGVDLLEFELIQETTVERDC